MRVQCISRTWKKITRRYLKHILSKMRLNVPLVRQRKDSSDCGPACASMLLKYYNYDVSVEEINTMLDRDGSKGMLTSI